MRWHKELQALAAEVVREHGLIGFKIEHGGKHLKIRLSSNSGERMVIASTTPSDVRTIYNVRGNLRRAARSLLLPPPVAEPAQAPPITPAS